MSTPILEMRGITKHFGALAANKNVDLVVQPGEIHGLLGENGAGKTTLMNILYGLYRQDSGEIKINGHTAKIASPREAIQRGIGMVHQHFMLVPNLTVTENVVLGQKGKGLFLSKKQAAELIKSKAQEYGVELDPWAKIEDLPVGLRQRVEIFKALFRGARLLILDEPTAVLTPEEVNQLFKLLRSFAGQGQGVICITHKLHEIKALCDNVTILRGGELVGTYSTREIETDELAALMVGEKASNPVTKKTTSKMGKVFLQVEKLSTGFAEGDSPLQELSFAAYQGEILGIAGVDGNGQTNLAQCLAGLIAPAGGKIVLDGTEVQGCSAKMIAARGVAYVPADRHRTGTVMGMSLAENMVVRSFEGKPFSSRGLLRWPKIQEYAKEKIEVFEIKTPSPLARLATLSGGNQQKVVLAREMSSKPRLIIAHQPTRGLDIGSTNYVHRVLNEAAEQGATVLLLSTELEELFAVCDRIAVLYRGCVAGIVPAEERYLKEIGMLMAGCTKAEGA